MAKKKKISEQDFMDLLRGLNSDQLDLVENIIRQANDLKDQGLSDHDVIARLEEMYGVDGSDDPVGRLPSLATRRWVGGLLPCTLQSKAQHYHRNRQHEASPIKSNIAAYLQASMADHIRVYKEARQQVEYDRSEKEKNRKRSPLGMKRYLNRVPYNISYCVECGRGLLWSYYGRYDVLGFADIRAVPAEALIEIVDKWLSTIEGGNE